jgi:molybdopterin-guanine dinucleotide biosynthesis protein A
MEYIKKNILRNLEEYLEGENDYAIRKFINKVNTQYMHLEGSEKYTHIFTNINSPSDISDIQNQRGIR